MPIVIAQVLITIVHRFQRTLEMSVMIVTRIRSTMQLMPIVIVSGHNYDCPLIPANIGDPCDDGNPNTINDLIDANCNCFGTYYDCPLIPANIGDPCNDGDPNTIDDAIDANCDCVGIPYDCPQIPGNIGDPCDDGNPNSSNDVIDENCFCLRYNFNFFIN